MQIKHKKLYPLPLLLALQSAFAATPPPPGFTIGAGSVVNTGQTIGSATNTDNTANVNGTISVSNGDPAITVTTGNGGIVTINNNGTIENTNGDENARGIYSKNNSNTLVINNAAGATISAVGDDAIKAGKAGAKVTITNEGTIWQKGMGVDAGQALDLADVAAMGSTLVNGSATNSAALIRADGADAINPASNMAITNYGTIISNGMVNTKCREAVAGNGACDSPKATSPADAIDVDKNTGVTVENYGIISGSRHGITADNEVQVTNYAGGQIIGRNGSGVGSDGTATVTNYGLISGRYAGAGNVYDHTLGGTLTGVSPSINDGDGDGVDIDGVGTIINYGRIEGTGGGGSDADGNPNAGDGIAMGGGTITNHAGASIWGKSNGILIDDGANGTATASGRGTSSAAPAAAVITNDGSITGDQGVAIGLVGNFDDKIINGVTGVITGGANTVRVDQLRSTTPGAAIQMGGGNDELDNHGRIEGKNGMAIDMGDGDDTLRLFAGSIIIGTVDGGSGTNLLETNGTQIFTAGQFRNFQNLTVNSGSTTFNYDAGNFGKVQIAAGGSLRVNGSFGTSGDLTVNGTLQAPVTGPVRTTSIGGNYLQGASGVLETRIGGAGNDRLSVAQTATLSAGATIRPLLSGYVNDGASFTILDAGTLATTATALNVDSKSAFLSYSVQQQGNDLVLVAHRSQSLTSMLPQGQAGVLPGLLGLFNTDSQSAINLVNAFEALPDAGAVRNAVSQLAPQNNAAMQSVSTVAQNSVFSSFGNRIDAARDGGAVAMAGNTGLAGGDAAGGRFWLQGLAALGTQRARAGANGFNLNAQGLDLGFEADLNARDMVGVSAGYTEAGNDGRDAADGDNGQVKSVHAGGYFSRTERNYTLDASVVLSINRNYSQRLVAFPGFSDMLSASYSGYQIGTRVEYGIPFTLNGSWSGRALVGARLSHLDNDGYAETGGLAAQRVGSSSANSTQSVLGVEFTDRMDTATSTTLRARYLHEFSDTPAIDATFVNGGPAFRTDGVQPGRDALELGIGFRKSTAQGTVISVGYDLEVRDRYLGHQLTARAMWHF